MYGMAWIYHTYEEDVHPYILLWYIWLVPRDRSIIKGPPPSNASLHDAYCKKSKTMLDFVAVKYVASWATSPPPSF